MKCPYAVHQKTVTQTHIEYNEDGNQKSWTEYQNNKAEFAECQGQECGAWRDGCCHYSNNK